MGMTVRRRLLSVAVLLVASALALFAAEVAVRFFLPQYDPRGGLSIEVAPEGLPLGPKNAVVRQRKNTGDYDVQLRFNAYGFRDDADVADSEADEWVVVGDSFSMGWGVEEEEKYSEMLEALLGMTVYNIAAPSAHIRTYAHLLDYAQRHGLQAQQVIVGICMENDLLAYDRPPRVNRPKIQRKVRQRLRARFGRVKRYLAEHSALYFLATSAVHQSETLRGVAQRIGWMRANMPSQRNTPLPQEVIDASVALLVDIAQPYDKTKIVLIPSRGLWLGEHRGIEAATHARFVQALAQTGLEVLDLKEAFEQENNPLAYHFTHDGHWNPQGHRLAAETLYASLNHD